MFWSDSAHSTRECFASTVIALLLLSFDLADAPVTTFTESRDCERRIGYDQMSGFSSAGDRGYDERYTIRERDPRIPQRIERSFPRNHRRRVFYPDLRPFENSHAAVVIIQQAEYAMSESRISKKPAPFSPNFCSPIFRKPRQYLRYRSLPLLPLIPARHLPLTYP